MITRASRTEMLTDSGGEIETVMEKKWADEEEVSGEVEGGGGLDTKRQRKLSFSNDAPLPAGEDQEDAKYFSPDNTSSRSTEAEIFVAEKYFDNGNSVFTNILDDLHCAPNAREKHDHNHIKALSEPNLHIHSVDDLAGAVVEATQPETPSHIHNSAANLYKLNVEELDLEKVIEEQETHDLFCPHCHSCITKRVILRKRKRRAQDFQHEERPEKLHAKSNIGAATFDETGETSGDNEPDVFRCLSCLSFFIPTDNGFNIFQIFRKRNECVSTQVLTDQSSEQASSRDGTWLSLFFKPDSSTKKGTVLPVHPDLRYPGQSIQASPALILSKTPDYTDDEKSKNEAQLPQLEVSFGGDQLVENKSITALHIPVPVEVQASYASDGMITQLPVDLQVSFGGSRILNDNKSAQDIPVSDISKTGASYSTKLKISSDDIIPVFINKTEISSEIDENSNDAGVRPPAAAFLSHDLVKHVGLVEPSSSQGASPKDLSVSISSALPTIVLPQGDVQINVGDQILLGPRRESEWEVLKSIIYGGLTESITSLGVVSSAAGADTSTLNVVALGLANLIGGFFVILNDLSELKSSAAAATEKDERTDRYWKLLGRKSNFSLHATIAVISYIFFGLLPPVIYGFSFRKSDQKEYKLIAVASSLLLCVALLAIGKAHVSEPKSYIKTFLYYLGLAFTASGLSYVTGVLIDRFLQQFGLFEHNAPLPSPPPSPFDSLLGFNSSVPLRANM